MKRLRFAWVPVVCLAFQLWLPAPAAAQHLTTPNDQIPNFAAAPTKTSAGNGSWFTAATWSPQGVPTAGDIVRVQHLVTFENTGGVADVVGIEAGGTLRFATNVNTRLTVGTLLVQTNGTLEVGTEAQPVQGGVTAEIVIKDKALNLGSDPGQYGTGLISVNGTVRMHGKVRTPTFVRLAAEPQAGHTTLTLAESVGGANGWAVGDLLILPESREDPDRINDAQVERRTVQSISGDGLTITLSSALTFRHPGARNSAGTIVFQPHVMNSTRNIVIRSENPSGTRGHSLLTHRSVIDIRYAEFRDLGRTTISALNDNTNRVGRYALHLHHLMGPVTTPSNGYQFTVLGNAVLDSSTARSRIKWPIAVHNSHYGLVESNTVYNAGGSGIVTEDGSESFNVIQKNMVVRVLGEGDRHGVKAGGISEPGSQGIGLWFRGPNNHVRYNVAANSVETQAEAGYGFEMFLEFLGNVRIPNFKGADTSVAGQYTTKSPFSIPLLEWVGNETYGVPQGITFWWLGMDFHTPVATADSVFADMRMWHVSRYPIYGYNANKVVFDGLQVYGDPTVGECCNVIWYGDYLNKDAVIRNSTIVGIEAVILPYHGMGVTRVENSHIAATSGLAIRTSGAPGACPNCNLPDRVQVVENVTFAAVPGSPLRSVNMSYHTHGGFADFDSKDQTWVVKYQGQNGNDFRTYYNQQAGTTAVAGEQAACTDTTTRPEILGISCGPPTIGTPPPQTNTPPGAPTNLHIVSP